MVVQAELFFDKKKENSKIKGELDLTNLLYEKFDARFEEKNTLFIKEKDFGKQTYFRFRVTFNRDVSTTFALTTNSEEDFNNFIENLRPICICLNFKEDFSLVKVIGKGNFAKVYDKFLHDLYQKKKIGFSRY